MQNLSFTLVTLARLDLKEKPDDNKSAFKLVCKVNLKDS